MQLSAVSDLPTARLVEPSLLSPFVHWPFSSGQV